MHCLDENYSTPLLGTLEHAAPVVTNGSERFYIVILMRFVE